MENRSRDEREAKRSRLYIHMFVVRIARRANGLDERGKKRYIRRPRWSDYFISYQHAIIYSLSTLYLIQLILILSSLNYPILPTSSFNSRATYH